MEIPDRQNKYGVNVVKVTVGITLQGVLFGMVMPGLYLLLAYYLDSTGKRSSRPHEEIQLIFWGLVTLSVIGAVVAISIRKMLFKRPMIVSIESFGKDFKNGIQTSSTILYALTNAIALYGMLYFFLGGELDAVALFCIFSVIAIQIVRPRLGFVEETLEHQEKLVAEGKFLTRRE